VAFRFVEGKYFVGAASGTVVEGAQVAVLIDDGEMYFDLRGVRVRGRLSRTTPITTAALEWFEVHPELVVAWDYGSMHPR